MTIITHAVIRAWAISEGMNVPKRGPLPTRIIKAYYAANDRNIEAAPQP